MKQKMLVTGAIFCVFLASCKEGHDGIAVLGMDDQGRELHTFVPQDTYSKNLTDLLTSVNDTTVPVLAEADYRAATAANTSLLNDVSPLANQPVMSWGLRTVIVGVGLKFEFGIPTLVKMTVAPKTRVAFSNSKKPVVP